MPILHLLASVFLPLVLALPVAPQTTPRTVPLEGVISKDIRYSRANYDRLVQLRGGIAPTVFELGHPWLRTGTWQTFANAKPIMDQYVSYGAKHIVFSWCPCHRDSEKVLRPDTIVHDPLGTMAKQITQYAADLDAWMDKHPSVTVYIRFAHEMDGSHATYSDGVYDNDAGDFVALWKHVTRHFRPTAPAAKWIWSALAPMPDWWPDRWKQHFPCDAWTTLSDGTPSCTQPINVDMVCVTLYLNHPNWPVRTPMHEISLASHRLSQLAPGLPKCLSEFGIFETSDRKQKASQWTDVLTKVLPSQPFKFALVYHWNSDERDAKHLESSPEALRAYKDGIRYLRKGK